MATPGARISAGGWKALLVSPSRKVMSELVPLLAQTLPSLPITEFQGYPDHRTLIELKTTTPCNLVFLDVMADSDAAMSCIPDLLGILPGVRIVVLVSSKQQDFILQCLRQGATEFLVHPFTAEQIQTVAERLSRLDPVQKGEGAGKVFCVMPAKGACGASTIACNLAYQWKRFGPRRILLADLDPMTGTISFLMKLKPAHSFFDAVAHSSNLDTDLWRGMVTQSGGIDLLLPPDNPMEGIHEVNDTTPIINFTRHLYDDIVVDLNGAYGEWSLTAIRLADEIMLVTTNELPALQAVQRVLGYLESNRIPKSRVKLLVNRYNKDVGLSKEMIETALRVEVFHVLPSDYEGVQRALLEGRTVSPASGFGKSLALLADRLSGQEEQSHKASSEAGSSLFSKFGSLFSKRT